MVNKIRLLGMEIENYSLREEVLRGEAFIDQGELNIIRTISMKLLSMAADNRLVRDSIGQADLLIIGDKEILMEAGIHSSQRLREASEFIFMKEYLKRMSYSQRRVFLVAADSGKLGTLQEYLDTAYEKLQIAGKCILEESAGIYDNIINEINASAPEAVLSVLESPQEENFLLEAGTRLNAKVWYSLGEHYHDPQGRPSICMRLQQLIHKGRFKNKVHNYEDGGK